MLDGENFINTINVYINLYPNATSLLSWPVCLTYSDGYPVGSFEFTLVLPAVESGQEQPVLIEGIIVFSP